MDSLFLLSLLSACQEARPAITRDKKISYEVLRFLLVLRKLHSLQIQD